MQRKTLLIVFVLILATFGSFVYFWPDGNLHFIACDVGQGDAILLTQGFNQVLIDGGPNDRVLGCLARNMPFWDRTIEMVVNTHQDKDHLYGLVSVIERYNVQQLVINSVVSESKLFEEFHQLVKDKKPPIYSPKQGEKIKLSKLELSVLWPEEKLGDLALWQQPLEKAKVLGIASQPKKMNETSIVFLAHFGDFEALLTGDITSGEEEEIADYCSFEDCGQPIELLKIAHHGSKTSSCQKFLNFFQPELAVISVGENQWGHPVKEVLERIEHTGAKILRTDQMGDIKIVTDGRRIFW